MWEQDCIEPHGVSVLHGVVTSVSVEAVIAHFIARNSKTSSMFVFQQMTPQWTAYTKCLFVIGIGWFELIQPLN